MRATSHPRRRCGSWIAEANLAGALDGEVLPADRRLGEWTAAQTEDDLDYLRIAQERAEAAREAVRSALARAVPRTGPEDEASADVAGKVFVVHGRDFALRDRFVAFLTDLGLRPLDWEELVAGAGDGPSPYIGEVVARAPG